jgi:hypothetical protein
VIYHEIAPSAAANFSDMPQAEGEEILRQFEYYSAPSFGGEVTFPGWKYVGVSWLFTKGDKTIPPSMQ